MKREPLVVPQQRDFGTIRIVHVASLNTTLMRFVVPIVQQPAQDCYEHVFASGDVPDAGGRISTRLHISRTTWSILVSWLRFASNTRALTGLSPSGIHVHTPATAIALRPALSILRRRNVRLIYTSRGGFDEGGTWTRRALWSLLNPLRWSIWDGVCVTNERLLVEARAFGHKDARKISLGAALPNVPPRANLDQDSSADPEPKPLRLAWVGRLDRDKRFEDFVYVVRTLNRTLPRGCVGEVIGDSLPGDRPQHITSRPEVRFHGHVDVPAVIVANCELLISTSLREGYGLSPLEAALVGTPTIAIANHGTRESVPPVGGLLVEPGALDHMVDLARDIAELPATESSRLRQKVQVMAQSLLSRSDPAKEVLDLYRAVFSA